MKALQLSAVMCVCLAAVGCGNSYEQRKQLAYELIDEVNAMADTLETVKDKASAKATASKVKQHRERIAAIKKQAEELPKLSKSKSDELKADFEPKLKEAQKRLAKNVFRAMMRSRAEPTFVAEIKQFKSLSN